MRRADYDAMSAAARGISTEADIDRALELERLRLRREEMKYLQTVRTGKPADPAVPGRREGAHIEAAKITQQVVEMEAFHDAIIKVADRVRPKANPYEFLNSKMMEGIGSGLGNLVAVFGREVIERRKRSTGVRGPTIAPTGPANQPLPPAPALKPLPSGFVGTLNEPRVADNPAPASPMVPQGQAPASRPVELRLSDNDKDIFARTQRTVQAMAELQGVANRDVSALTKLIREQNERIARLEASSRPHGDDESLGKPEAVEPKEVDPPNEKAGRGRSTS